MMKKEIEMREGAASADNSLMKMLRKTENKINNIVDKGQKEIQERKNSRCDIDEKIREREQLY